MTDCEHARQHGEHTCWPDDAALDHFDHCLTPDERLEVWRRGRADAATGVRCSTYRHDARLVRLDRDPRP